jgi:hypothetical protein
MLFTISELHTIPTHIHTYTHTQQQPTMPTTTTTSLPFQLSTFSFRCHACVFAALLFIYSLVFRWLFFFILSLPHKNHCTSYVTCLLEREGEQNNGGGAHNKTRASAVQESWLIVEYKLYAGRDIQCMCNIHI